MKIHRKILFGILLTLAVLFCFGMKVYSNSNIRSFSVELSSGPSSDEFSFFSDIDSFDDDQIKQINEIRSFVEHRSQLPIPQNYFLIFKFLVSVWQPPKIS
jgi:hypothetical protein